jgi:hypothetical protein
MELQAFKQFAESPAYPYDLIGVELAPVTTTVEKFGGSHG